jgi:signal transduction histidine kinase
VTPNPRIAILPLQVASEVITAAVARGGWLVSIILVVLDIPVVIDVVSDRGDVGALPIPLVVLGAMLVLLLLVGRSKSVRSRLLYIGGCVLCAVAFAASLLFEDPTIGAEATYVVNRPAIALILLSPVVLRPVLGIIWSTIGLVVSVAVLVVASALAGVQIVVGWGPFTAWAVYAVAYLVLSLVRVSQSSAIPDIPRLESETRRMALETQFEQRAAAMIHDTLLGDLTAIMNTNGDLEASARHRFRADVATLKDPSWLRGTDVASLDGRDAALRNGSIALASEMQWRGLSVDLMGTNDTVVTLSPSATTAVHEALRACLDNVIVHSGVNAAQLVAGGDSRELTYLVVDHGVGFESGSRSTATLGVSASVIEGIEAHGGSVRVWSQPGNGTSVLISIPTRPREGAESDDH